MNMITPKKVGTKNQSLILNAYESDDSNLDKEQATFITKNLKKFFRRENM